MGGGSALSMSADRGGQQRSRRTRWVTPFLRPPKGYEALMKTVRLPPQLQSALEARRFVEDELRPAGAGDDTLLHAQLLATELVTNAARHAQSPVDLIIASGNGRVRIEARDDSAALPTAPLVDTPRATEAFT